MKIEGTPIQDFVTAADGLQGTINLERAHAERGAA
jgi:hypothetical protein